MNGMRIVASLVLVAALAAAAAEPAWIGHDTFAEVHATPSGLSPYWVSVSVGASQDTVAGVVVLNQPSASSPAAMRSISLVPARRVEVLLRHRMAPAGTRFAPALRFVRSSGEAVSIEWVRSAAGPEACGRPEGIDRVLMRDSSGCRLSALAASPLQGAWILSRVRFDAASGRLLYDLGDDGTIDFAATAAAADRAAVTAIELVAGGADAGNRHELDAIDLWSEPDPAWPSAPLAPAAAADVPLVMTAAEYGDFGARRFFEIPEPGTTHNKNHEGIDIALTPYGDATTAAATIGAEVHALCDGTVIGIRPASTPVSHMMMHVHHPRCGPGARDLMAYYGHTAVLVRKGDTVARGQVIATVRPWDVEPGPTWTHLHLTLDTDTARNLGEKLWYACLYTMDGEGTVTHVSDCQRTERAALPGAGRVRLRMGFARTWADAYREPDGTLQVRDVYLAEAAMRELGLIPLYDLWRAP